MKISRNNLKVRLKIFYKLFFAVWGIYFLSSFAALAKDYDPSLLYGIELTVSDRHKATQNEMIEDYFNHPESVFIPVYEEPNRHGQHEIIIQLGKETLQKNLLEKGLARFYINTEPRLDQSTYQSWQTAEEKARRQKIGLWAQNDVISKTDNIPAFQFAIVEGIITEIYQGKKAVFINFGQDWRKDFTIIAQPELWNDLPTLSKPVVGKKIEIRGWVEDYYGPMIKLNSPYQLSYPLHKP